MWPSTTWCTSYMPRFHGSNGSAGDAGPVVAQPASITALAATAVRRPEMRRRSPILIFCFSQRRRLVEQELTDQLLEHDRRLRLGDHAAVREHLRIAAGVEADVHLAEQPRRENRGDRVLAELITLVDRHRHDGAIHCRIEAHALDPPDDDARGLHRRAQL